MISQEINSDSRKINESNSNGLKALSNINDTNNESSSSSSSSSLPSNESVSSLRCQTNCRNRCLLCYRLLRTTKGAKLCKSFSVNTVLHKRKKRHDDAAISGGGSTDSANSSENLNESTNGELNSRIIEDGLAVKKISEQKVKNEFNENTSSCCNEDAREEITENVILVNGDVNRRGENAKNESSTNFTIGDLIESTLEFSNARRNLSDSLALTISSSNKHSSNAATSNHNKSTSSSLETANGRHVCVQCLNSVKLIKYHSNHAAKLKRLMLDKLKLTSRFGSFRLSPVER